MAIFGRPSLIRTGFWEGFLTAKLFKGLVYIDSQQQSSIDNIPTSVIIQKLESVIEQEPKNWLALYCLGDWYSRDKRYAEAIKVLKKAYRIRPKDPRSAYALASTYRVLTRARFEGMDLREIFPSSQFRMISQEGNFDPAASAREIKALGLTIEEAAEKAMIYFEKTLSIGVRSDEKHFVVEFEKMYADFPQLELKVKNQRDATDGLFQDAQKGSSGIYNEAKSHYTRLRFLMSDLPRFRYELGEVIRLCLWSIAVDDRQGDGYVLLANAYSLLDNHVGYSSPDRFYYERWAASLIQHWSETPLRNYPFTKNTEIGITLYNNILDEVIRELKCSREQAISQMKVWSQEYLLEALNPASYGKIKEQLENQPLQ